MAVKTVLVQIDSFQLKCLTCLPVLLDNVASIIELGKSCRQFVQVIT